MGVQEIVSGHTHATGQRIRAQEVVWLVQDTTLLHDGTTQPQAGMGTVKSKTRAEYLLHLTVAFTPERVNGGVAGRQVWQRPAEPVAQPAHKQTHCRARELSLAGGVSPRLCGQTGLSGAPGGA